LLFRQGVPPYATYLFKHALVQDAAYGTLLREPRRALHVRIAETLESHIREQPGSGNAAPDKNKNPAGTGEGRYEPVVAKSGEGRFGFIISQ
jgi:predicted ATPase